MKFTLRMLSFKKPSNNNIGKPHSLTLNIQEMLIIKYNVLTIEKINKRAFRFFYLFFIVMVADSKSVLSIVL